MSIEELKREWEEKKIKLYEDFRDAMKKKNERLPFEDPPGNTLLRQKDQEALIELSFGEKYIEDHSSELKSINDITSVAIMNSMRIFDEKKKKNFTKDEKKKFIREHLEHINNVLDDILIDRDEYTDDESDEEENEDDEEIDEDEDDDGDIDESKMQPTLERSEIEVNTNTNPPKKLIEEPRILTEKFSIVGETDVVPSIPVLPEEEGNTNVLQNTDIMPVYNDDDLEEFSQSLTKEITKKYNEKIEAIYNEADTYEANVNEICSKALKAAQDHKKEMYAKADKLKIDFNKKISEDVKNLLVNFKKRKRTDDDGPSTKRVKF